jgi:predicted CopG family antitoxin
VYEQLRAHKRPGESFSDVVERLLEGERGDWRKSIGILSDEEASELREFVRRRRERSTESHEERMDELFG